MNTRAHPVSPEDLLLHADWLRRLAARLVHDPERAEDIAQETWRRALEKPPREHRDLRGWLAVAARHVAQQTGRAERARAAREQRAARTEATSSAADVVEQASLQRDLAAHVLALEEPYRTALLLRYFRDLPPASIAERLGIPRNTVRSHLARGLALLRERLDTEAGGRESWLRAVTPLAALASKSGTRALAWPPVLTGLTAAVGAVALATQLARAPAPEAPPAQLVAAGAPVLAPTGTVAPPALVQPPSEQRAALAGSAASIPPSLASAGGGVLDLRFVDAETGTPLAGLEFCVFKERGGNRLFHRGVADQHGAARVGDLPENVILVQTARRPPHAIGFAALWLGENERRALEVDVGRGGRILGRAVDDRGTPLPGLDVTLPGGPCAYRGLSESSELTDPAARTDKDGRFVVGAIGELPRGVWIVEGEPRPETWLPQRATLRSERFPCWSLASASGVVRAGEDLDVGDLVVPRPVIYEGVVLDGEREPVAGALVSLDPHRIGTFAGWWNRAAAGRPLPGAPGFELEGVDVLTAADGAFRIEAPWSSQPRRFLVWTAAGRRGRPAAPGLAPGEVRDGIELTISSATALALDLRGPGGAPVDFAELNPDLILRGRYALLPAIGAARVLVASRSGEMVELEPEPDADGLLRLSSDLLAGDVRALDVFVPGFLPARADLPGGFPAEPLVLDLRPTPRLRVRLELGGEPPTGEKLSVRVAACRVGVETIPSEDRWARCCGFGCLATARLGGEPIDLDLPVFTDEPYWLTVYANAGGQFVPARVLGPFRPTADVAKRILVRVDPGELRPHERTAAMAAREQRAPPALAEPSTARAVELQRSLQELGYAESPDEAPPRPGFVARLTEADGTPVAEGMDALVVGAGQDFLGREGRVEADGQIAFPGELPGRFVLAVNTELGGFYGSAPSDRGFQLLHVDGWSPGVARELRLAPWRSVEVVVRGLLDEDAVLRASLRVSPPASVLPRPEGRPSVGRNLREIAPTEPRSRRFRIASAPGNWTVTGTVGLLEVPPTTIEVRDVEGIQRSEVFVRRP